MPLEELPADQEVCAQWGDDYALWHNRFWKPDRYLLIVQPVTQLLPCLRVPGRWAILTKSVLQAAGDIEELRCYTLAGNPPLRTCYQVTHREPLPRTQQALEIIEPELRTYIAGLIQAGLVEPAA